MKEYLVNYITEQENELLLKNKNSNLWEKANCLTDFCSPWCPIRINRIEFRSLWSSQQLFFNFRVFDTSIYVDKKDASFDSIGNSDRVELFFRKDKKINPYYCLEIDASARIMDFKAQPNRIFDFDWNWPENEIKVASYQDKLSFTVTGQISISSLKKLELIQNNVIETGIYRAKFSKNKEEIYEPTWISWVNPNTETPNFHTDSSFGKLVLETK